MAKTKLEKLEEQAARVSSASEHAQRLIESLVDLTAWSFTGNVIDHGAGATNHQNAPRCVCGHPVRYHYEIRADRDVGNWKAGDTTYVGSVCIGQVGYLNPGLANAIKEAEKKLMEKLKEAKKKAHLAQIEERVKALREEYDELLDRLNALYDHFRNRGLRAPYDLWAAVASYKWRLPQEPPKYQRAGNYVRWYEKKIKEAKRVLDVTNKAAEYTPGV